MIANVKYKIKKLNKIEKKVYINSVGCFSFAFAKQPSAAISL